MSKMSNAQKESITQMFDRDFDLINTGIRQQLSTQWEKTKKQILAEHNATDNRNKIAKVEAKLEALNEEKLAFMSAYETRKSQFTAEKDALEKETMGELKAKPAPKLILALGFDPDRYHYSSKGWYGMTIENQLDALTAERIRTTVDLGQVMQMFQDVQNAVRNELRFAIDFDVAKTIYDRFRAYNFEKFGIKLTPRMADIESKPEFKALQAPAKPQTKTEQKLLKAKKAIVTKKENPDVAA